MSDAAISKPLGGAPPANKNAQKHGLYAKDAGQVDMRRREDRAVAAALQAIEDDFGGGTALSAQERVIIANFGRRLKDLFKIDTYLDTLSSIANRRTRTLWPVVLQKHLILDAIRHDLESLSLERRAREIPTLASYLEARRETRRHECEAQRHAERAPQHVSARGFRLCGYTRRSESRGVEHHLGQLEGRCAHPGQDA
jgi:hypothetical protein